MWWVKMGFEWGILFGFKRFFVEISMVYLLNEEKEMFSFMAI